MNLSHKIQGRVEQTRLRKGRKQLYCKNHLEIRNFLSKNCIFHGYDIAHKRAKINYRGEGKKILLFYVESRVKYIQYIHRYTFFVVLKFYESASLQGKKCVKRLLKRLQYQYIYQYGDSTQEFSISAIPSFLF